MFQSSRMRYGTATLGLVAGILSVGQVAEAASLDRAITSVEVWAVEGPGWSSNSLPGWFKDLSLWIDTNGDTSVEKVAAKTSYKDTGKTYTAGKSSGKIWNIKFDLKDPLHFQSGIDVNWGVKGIGKYVGSGQSHPLMLLSGQKFFGERAFADGKYNEYYYNGQIQQFVDEGYDFLVRVKNGAGEILTNRSLDNVDHSTLVPWYPPEARYGQGKDLYKARFKGDDFNTVPTPGLLFGAVGMGIQALRKKRRQRQQQCAS